MKKPKSPFGRKSPEGLETGGNRFPNTNPTRVPGPRSAPGTEASGIYTGVVQTPGGGWRAPKHHPRRRARRGAGAPGKGRDAGGDGAAMGKSGDLSPVPAGSGRSRAAPAARAAPCHTRTDIPAATDERESGARTEGAGKPLRESASQPRVPGAAGSPRGNFPARGGAAGHSRSPGTSRTLPGSSRTGTY